MSVWLHQQQKHGEDNPYFQQRRMLLDKKMKDTNTGQTLGRCFNKVGRCHLIYIMEGCGELSHHGKLPNLDWVSWQQFGHQYLTRRGVNVGKSSGLY